MTGGMEYGEALRAGLEKRDKDGHTDIVDAKSEAPYSSTTPTLFVNTSTDHATEAGTAAKFPADFQSSVEMNSPQSGSKANAATTSRDANIAGIPITSTGLSAFNGGSNSSIWGKPPAEPPALSIWSENLGGAPARFSADYTGVTSAELDARSYHGEGIKHLDAEVKDALISQLQQDVKYLTPLADANAQLQGQVALLKERNAWLEQQCAGAAAREEEAAREVKRLQGLVHSLQFSLMQAGGAAPGGAPHPRSRPPLGPPRGQGPPAEPYRQRKEASASPPAPEGAPRGQGGGLRGGAPPPPRPPAQDSSAPAFCSQEHGSAHVAVGAEEAAGGRGGGPAGASGFSDAGSGGETSSSAAGRAASVQEVEGGHGSQDDFSEPLSSSSLFNEQFSLFSKAQASADKNHKTRRGKRGGQKARARNRNREEYLSQQVEILTRDSE